MIQLEEDIVKADLSKIERRTDKMFLWLLMGQWIFAVVIALVWSPRTWIAEYWTVHQHVIAALVLGGFFASYPIYLILRKPGSRYTRHIIAIGQMLQSALLVHVTGGRIETHFHVFGSLALLSFYRDWPVLITASVVVYIDHLLLGFWFPLSVYGVTQAPVWRSLEHAFWVLFEVYFLIISIRFSIKEMHAIASREVELEETTADLKIKNEEIATVSRELEGLNRGLENRVAKRTEELLKANEALRESEHKIHLVIETANDAFVAMDSKGKITGWNQQAEKIFGWSKSDAVGRALAEVIIPHQLRDAHRKGLARYFQTGEGPVLNKRIEITALHRDGHEFPVELTVWPVKTGNDVSFNAFIRDITEKKRLESMILQSEKMSAVGQLAAGVAHEINNPLGVILGFSQGLVKRLQLKDPLEMPLKSIEREALRCKTLVQNLLTFSRAEKTGKDEIDLNQAIEGALALVLAQGKVKNVEVIKKLDGTLPKIMANQNQIQQVVINLCNNSIDAMPHGGKVSITTGKNSFQGKDCIEIHVEDNGVGIPEEVLSKIFNPFFTTKEVGKGTGLGLSLVYEIVERHKGKIEVRSEVGKGTIFQVLLPLVSQ